MKLLLRHLALLRRARDSTHVYVTELVALVCLFGVAYFEFWRDFTSTLDRYPWAPVVAVVALYPRLNIKMTHDRVVMRWWVGPIPLPFGRREALSAGGAFECGESLAGKDAWTVDYSEGGLFVFVPFPSRLARALNVELKRVREGSSSNAAPEARVVSRGPEDKDA